MDENKQKKARGVIKSHLKTSGTKPVKVSEKMVTRWWNALNAAVFYNKLNPVTFKIKHVPNQFACVHVWYDKRDRKIELVIDEKFVSRKLFLTVLSHEMVHVWDVQHRKKMGHRERFLAWEPRFRWILNLPLSSHLEEKDFDYRKYKRKRKKIGDGKEGITCRSVDNHGHPTIEHTNGNYQQPIVSSIFNGEHADGGGLIKSSAECAADSNAIN